MFNINSTIQTLLNAEKVKASRHLTDAEKIALLCDLRDTVTIMPGLPDHALAVRNVICRMIESERKPDQGRKAEGVEKPTKVAAGRAEEGSEAAKGTTQGVQEPTEDAGRADRSKPRKLKQAPATKAPEA